MKSYLSLSILILASTLFSDTISGKVVDELNKSIRGVNVIYKNTGTVTDSDGIFFIEANIGDEINIHHIGYKFKTIIINSNFIEVVLISTPIKGETIFVESGFKKTSLIKAPSSISIIDQHKIKNKGGDHFDSFSNSISNLNWASGTSRPKYFQIRGIGENELFSGQGASNFSVGFTIDNIDFTGIGMPANLFDMRQIQVLKGPQSTIYGSNAMAGLISIESNDPVPYFEGNGLFSIGSDLIQYGVVLNTPIDKNFDYRMSILYSLGTGFRENTYHDDPYTNRRQELFYKSKIKWYPTSNFSLTLSAIVSDQNNGYDAWAPDNNTSLESYSDNPGEDSQKTAAVSIKTFMRINNSFDVVYLSSFSNHNMKYSYDSDWGNSDYWEGNEWYNYFDESIRTRQSLTNEVRFISNNTPSITIGFYSKLLRENDDATAFIFDMIDQNTLDAEFDHQNTAAYTEIGFSLSDKIGLTLNTRLENSKINYSSDIAYNTGYDTSYYPVTEYKEISYMISDDLISFKGALSYQISLRKLIFTSISKGYKSGGINQSPFISDDDRKYNPEYNWNLEFGYRAFTKKHNFDITFFYMKRENQQVQISTQMDENPSSYTYYTANATSGYNYGFELGEQYAINKNLILSMNTGYLKTWIDSYKFIDPTDGIEIILGGREGAHAPAYTFSTTLDYTLPAGIGFNIEYLGKDWFYISDNSDQKTDNYTLLNASINYKFKSTSITVWGKNLTDERYIVKGFYFALEPPDWTNKFYKQWGDPVEYGLTIQFEF